MERANRNQDCGAAADFLAAGAKIGPDGLEICSRQVVQYWERPLMRQLARFASRSHGRVLEIGYGLGMCSRYIQSAGVEDHLIVEAHPQVCESARRWATGRPCKIRIVEDFWEAALPGLGCFDAIVFDPHPLSTASVRHYDGFIPVALRHLNPGGVLTYISLERELSADHHDLLFGHFGRVEIAYIGQLSPPPTCAYWHGDRMAIPCAIAGQ